PTSEANISETNRCPLCGEPLENPNECSKCDWVKDFSDQKAKSSNRDMIAALLSVPVPGLGHVYKGHTKIGVMYLLGTAVVTFMALVFTMYFGWFLVPLYW